MFLFLSDAHLGIGTPEDQDKRVKFLFECLDHYAPRMEKLFIMGDLFDFWFEWRHVILKQYFHVLCKLSQLNSNGVELHYLAGNHDFALGSFIRKEIGMQLHLHNFQFESDGKRFFLLHGDGLAPADWGYRILKRVLRSRFNQRLFSALHPDFGLWLAHKSSHTSRKYSRRRWDIDSEAYLQTARKLIEQGNDYVLIAHTHEPLLQSVGSGIYVNTGDWMQYFSYAIYTNGRMALKYWGSPFLERSENSREMLAASSGE